MLIWEINIQAILLLLLLSIFVAQVFQDSYVMGYIKMAQ